MRSGGPGPGESDRPAPRRVAGSRPGHFWPTSIIEISRKGIRIASDSPLRDTGEHNFVIKSSWLDHDIPVMVRIVWNDTSAGIRNYGARFISISPENVFELLDPLYHDWVEEASKRPEQYS